MSFFASILRDFGLGANWLLFFLFLIIGFGYGLALGRNRLGLVLISSYVSLLITKSLPWQKIKFLGLEDAPDPAVLIFLFLAVILALFFLAPHSGLSAILKISSRGRASWWQLLIFGFFELGFLLSVVLSFLPYESVKELNPLAASLFIDEPYHFLWLLMPFASLIVLKKRRSHVYGGDE